MKKYRFLFQLCKWVIIPFVLPIIGFFVFYILNSQEPLSIATYPKTTNDKIIPIEKPLLKGEIIKGTFTSKSNNLGLLAIRFNTGRRAVNDLVIFRIKENNQRNWYYQATYKTDQFQHNQLFTFGFPIIINSYGKTYDFQIESTSGNIQDSIAVSSDNPIFISQYKYSLSYVISHPVDTIDFFAKKAINTSPNLKDLLEQVIYLIPLIFYIFSVLIRKDFGAKIFYTCFTLFVIFMIVSPEFNQLTLQDFRIIAIFWTVGIFSYKLRSEVTFLLSAVLLSISFITFMYGNLYLSEKFAMFLYWSFIVALIELSLEVGLRRKFKRGYREFARLVFR